MSVSGSLKKVIIDGINFDVISDVDVTIIGSGYSNESISTSGNNFFKMTKRPENIEGVVVSCNSQNHQRLKSIADGINVVPLSIQLADNSVYRSTGKIDIENRTTMENRATLKLLPETSWTVFG